MNSCILIDINGNTVARAEDVNIESSAPAMIDITSLDSQGGWRQHIMRPPEVRIHMRGVMMLNPFFNPFESLLKCIIKNDKDDLEISVFGIIEEISAGDIKKRNIIFRSSGATSIDERNITPNTFKTKGFKILKQPVNEDVPNRQIQYTVEKIKPIKFGFKIVKNE